MGAIRLRTVPLFGMGVAGKSFVSTRQRRLNCYVETRPDKDKSRFAIYGTPGLKMLGKTQVPGAARGILGNPTNLFVVNGGTFQAITNLNPITSQIPSGNLATLFNPVTLATNNNQVIIADGKKGLIYNVAQNTLSTIGQAFPDKANTCTFVSSFFVAEQPGTQQFWVSDVNDGSTWDGLAFASASAYSGFINAVDNLGGNLITFSTDHVEFWVNEGTIPEPFQPVLSAAAEFGLAAVFSRAHVDESICFLCQNKEGQVQVAQITGYQVNIISSSDIDYIINNNLGDVSDAVGLAYGEDSHKFYQITFPTANRSFLYDSTTEVWSEVQTGPSIAPVRHIANFATTFGGETIVSDYSNNNLYTFDHHTFTDNGIPIAREVISRHILSDFNRIRVSSLYLDMETGVGLTNGAGSDPQIMLSYSKDNGRTWSGERWARLGKMGEYLTRVIWRRFGSTRDAVFKIRMTDPVKFVITDAAMRLRENGRTPNRAQSQGRME